ncbi:MAG TPA: recombinase family protein, partial [Acidimicrobiia bacterium]|nr:recombinase family protein [Acidimicrobiia bacterium]
MTIGPSIAVIYVRKSTVSEGRSLREQEADLRALAERLGLTVVEVLREEQSAYAERERPVFLAALRRCEETGAVLLTWSIDRFSRRGAEDILRVLPRTGRPAVRLITPDGVDTADENQRLNVIIQAEVAMQYSGRLSKNVNRAKKADRASGRWLGGSAPYGFVVTAERKLRLDPETSPILRRIVDDALAGKSLLSIARQLNAEGIPAPGRGRKNAATEWSPSRISALLRNPVLRGWLPKGSDTGQVARGDDGEPIVIGESLITPAEHRLIMDQVATRLRPGGGAAGRTAKSLLHGRAVCGRCGAAMASVGDQYRCAAKMNGSVNCAGNTVQVEKADQATVGLVLWYLQMVAMDYLNGEADDAQLGTLESVAAAWARAEDPDAEAARRVVEAEVADADAQLADLRDARYLRQEFIGAEDQYEVIRARHQSRRDQAATRLAEMPPPAAVTVEEVAEALYAGAQMQRS